MAWMVNENLGEFEIDEFVPAFRSAIDKKTGIHRRGIARAKAATKSIGIITRKGAKARSDKQQSYAADFFLLF
jgi:hypothetical protein